MRVHAPPGRAGFGLMVLVVVLAVVAILIGSITAQLLLNKTLLERRENQLQAQWLARAGLEVAAAKLLAGAGDYRGEALELVPSGTVRVEVRRDKDTYRVTSEASYPAGGTRPVVREAVRSFRRVADGERVRLDVLPEKGGAE